jgi:hypothetical protein
MLPVLRFLLLGIISLRVTIQVISRQTARRDLVFRQMVVNGVGMGIIIDGMVMV